MLDIPAARTQLAVAAARVVEALEADGLAVTDVCDVDIGERLPVQLEDFGTVLAATLGRGRTAAGDALAARLWAEIGGRL